MVVTIIAILAALLLPALGRAREKSKQAGCLSNIKQILIATQMYEQDNQDAIPNAILGRWWYLYFSVSPPFPPTIHAMLISYLKPDAAWYCPTAPSNSVAAAKYSATLTCGDNESSYRWIDEAYHLSSGTFTWLSGQPVATVPKPSAQEIIMDINTDFPGVHSLGLNVGYLDGHAQWDKISPLLAYYYEHSDGGFR